MEYSKLEIAAVSVWHQGRGHNRVLEIIKENSKSSGNHAFALQSM